MVRVVCFFSYNLVLLRLLLLLPISFFTGFHLATFFIPEHNNIYVQLLFWIIRISNFCFDFPEFSRTAIPLDPVIVSMRAWLLGYSEMIRRSVKFPVNLLKPTIDRQWHPWVFESNLYILRPAVDCWTAKILRE